MPNSPISVDCISVNRVLKIEIVADDCEPALRKRFANLGVLLEELTDGIQVAVCPLKLLVRQAMLRSFDFDNFKKYYDRLKQLSSSREADEDA